MRAVRYGPLAAGTVFCCVVLSASLAVAALPVDWSGVDVGSSPLAGSGAETGGTWTVTGNGADIWGTSDQCHYAYAQARGDFDVSCRITGMTGGTDGWRKAGLMARASLAADSRYAMTLMSGSNGVRFQWRTSDGGGSGATGPAGIGRPYYLRLVRSGDVFRSYTSPDGTSWAEHGSGQTIAMPDPIYLGFAVTSHNIGQLTTCTFEDVSGLVAARNMGAVPWIGEADLKGEFGPVSQADVTTFWGTTDGGMDPGAWDHAITNGTLIGSFSANVTGLVYGVLYHYRCYATNAMAEDWADATTSFVTVPPGTSANGLAVKTFNTAFTGAGHLNPIANLQSEIPAGLHELTGDLDFPQIDPHMMNVYPSITGPEQVAVLWEGKFRVTAAGPYSFGTDSDDGSVLYLDLNDDGDFADAGELVVDNNGNHGDRQRTGSVTLTPGYYPIVIGFYEWGGGDTMRAKWAAGNGVAWNSQTFINGDSGPFVLNAPSGGAISLTNEAPTAVTSSSAVFRGTLDATGSVFDVVLYWGPADGGTNTPAWAHTNTIGTYSNVVTNLSWAAGSLTPGTTYYYAFAATNAAGDLWAQPSRSFEALSVRVVADPVADVAATSATLHGRVLADGGAADPDVYVLWGTNDWGTASTGAWENVAHLGTRATGEAFSIPVNTLSSERPYWYRCYVTNVTGGGWSTDAVHFITAEVTLQVSDAAAAEEGSDPGQFAFHRPASSAAGTLTVNYAIGGTASNGLDYGLLGSSVTFSAGASNVTVTVTPVDDVLSGEANETVVLTLLPGAYVAGSPGTGTVVIADDDVRPDEFADLQLWLDAGTNAHTALGVAAGDGEAVQDWHDRSVNSHTARQVNVSTQPSYAVAGINSAPALVFDGSNAMSVAAASGLNAGIGQTVFVMFTRDSGACLARKGSASVGDWQITPSTYTVSGVGPSGLSGPGSGMPRLITGRYTGSKVQVYHNGILRGESLQAGVVVNTNDLALAAGAGGDPGLDGRIAELIIFQRSLSDTERGQVESYALAKYFGDIVFSDLSVPKRPTMVDPFSLSIEVAPLVAGTLVNVTLWYREGTSGGFTAIGMVNTSGNVYQTSLPIPGGTEATVQYYVEVVYSGASNGTATWPHAGSSGPASLTRFPSDTRQLGPSSRRTPLVISEIMYHPPSPYGNELEFVELYNSGPVSRDISGYRLSGEADFVFPDGTTIAGRSRLVVASDPTFAGTFFGIAGVLGPISNRLANGGGLIRLRNRYGAIIQEVEYSDNHPWPAAADGLGHSLVLKRPDQGTESVEAWDASTFVYGSPGTADPTPAGALAKVVINEVLAHTDLPQIDFVELHNPGTQAVDLSGCTLADQNATNPYAIPPGSVLAAGGFAVFTQTDLGFSFSKHGDVVCLRSADGNRVLDALAFGAQQNGVALGRYPDGVADYRVLSAVSSGAANSTPSNHVVAINEIMYNSVSLNTDDEYVELHNRGATPIDLTDWRFTRGIGFVFPTNATLPAGGYVVVAKDAARLMAAHPGTLTTANTFGDYSGQLADGGEHLVLARPDDAAIPTQDLVVVDEVWYGDGNNWGKWTDRGGSSLELVDPRGDNMRAMNWAGSDETAKTTNLWTLIEHTGVLDNGRNAADEIQILLENAGECLIDDIEVFKQSEGNRVANGSFETGIAGWIIQGTHEDSGLETTEGYQSAQSFHLRANRKGDHSVNRVESDFSSAFAQGDTVTIRARARWLCGHPGVLLRMHGNWLEAVGDLLVPANLGTPGARNSRYAANAGPAISDVAHSPILPAVNEAVLVTARVHDPDGIAGVVLKYRDDTAAPTITNTVAMNDSGTGADVTASDGIFSADIPGHAANRLVAFHVTASDMYAQPATNRFPAVDPTHECLVMFGQTDAGGTFGTYRFWITEANRLRWQTRQKLSDTPIPGTLVYGDCRAIYEGGGRFRGSPFIRQAGDPETIGMSFVLYAPKDDELFGARSFNLDRLEGDNCYQRERVSLWMAEQVDTPFFHQRYTHLYINERRKGTIYGDSQQPNDNFVGSWWPEGYGGDLHKIDDWFEFNDAAQVSREFNINGQLLLYTTTGGLKKKARYRWSWRKENVKGLDDDYSNFFELIDVMNMDHTTPEYAALAPAIVDYEEWMQVFAVEHIIRNWDSFGYNRGKNMSTYKPLNGRWQMIMWDLDHSHLTGDPNDNSLFSINCPTVRNKFFNHPPFRRAYWRAIHEMAHGPMVASDCNPVMDANYAALQANGVNVTSPDVELKQWVADRRAYLLGQLATVAAPFEITTNGGNSLDTDQGVFTLAGTAPVNVRTIEVNGTPYPLTFSSVTDWSLQVGLQEGVNVLTVNGYDCQGNLVGTDTIVITRTDIGVSPVGWLVINEIMYNPTNSTAEFVEIHNRSHTHPFDISGWRIRGVDFTFPAGSVILPDGYVVAVENSAVYASVYGNPQAVAGEFSGRLDNGGETLRLQMPSGTNNWITIDRVRYDDDPPWPPGADNGGYSLQLIDAAQDNNRVGNWATGGAVLYTPGAVNSVQHDLPGIPDIRINELQPNNLNTVADNAGDHDPWIELYDAGVANVLAVEVHQADPADGDLAMDLALRFTETGASTETTLVAAGSTWNYLDDGSDQGTAWRAVIFDDSGWADGPAKLGYGDTQNTLVSYGPDANDKHITTYFRQEFQAVDASSYTGLTLRAQRDDGIVVYLNGSEVWRHNMPAGAVGYETQASGAAGGAGETTWYAVTLGSGLLAEGTNVVAAELHQVNATSSDLGFDLELSGGRVTLGASTVVVPTNATWSYLDDGTAPGTNWVEAAFDDRTWSRGAATLGFGNGGETTALTSGHTTYYFRHAIDLGGASPTNPVIDLRVDDGAVVYLNGVEVFRTNMPAGAVSNTTLALTAVEGAAETNFSHASVSPAAFAPDGTLTNLDACYLTDDYANLTNWSFPSGVTMQRGDYQVVWADGEPGEQVPPAHLHASFALNAASGSVALVWVHDNIPIVLDFADYTGISVGRSQGLYPDGNLAAPREVFFNPTPGTTNMRTSPVTVTINEWMADNASTIRDPADLAWEDWIELHNAGTGVVDLAGFTLTDDVSDPSQWTFPAGASISAGGFLVVWTDSDPEQTAGEVYHTNFKLGKSGEEVALYTPDGVVVDWITFGAQTTDVSEGRWRDSAAAVYSMVVPTPGTNNVLPVMIVRSPHGTPVPARGTNVVTHGSVVDCGLGDSPVVEGGTTQHVCTGWVGTGSVPATGAATNVSVTVTSECSIAWVWQTNYWLDTGAGAHGSVDVADGWQSRGAGVTITPTPEVGYHFAGWAGDISASMTNDNPLVLNMTRPYSVTATFAVDVLPVEVTTPHGTPAPARGTNDVTYGSVVNFGLPDSPVVEGGTTQYVCTGWAGSGSVPATGSATNLSVTVTNASSISWTWRTNYWLDTGVAGNGSVDVADGWQARGSNVTIRASADPTYHFVAWSGDTNACAINGGQIEVPVNGPLQIMAGFAIDVHTVTFDLGTHGTRTGGGGLVQAVTHGGAAAAPVVEADPGWTFDGWDQLFGNVTADLTVTAQYLQITNSLSVVSEYGVPTPGTGIHAHAWGTVLTSAVTSPETLGTTQYVSAGWAGTGSVPASGAATNTGAFTITNDSSVTWLWVTNYWLDTGASGNGSVDVADGWQARGSNVTITPSPGVDGHFAGWVGDIPVSATNDNPLVLSMTRPYTVTASFTGGTHTITASVGPDGTIAPSGAVAVAFGANRAFTITPDTDYIVETVTVDAVSVGRVSNYTFTNVVANHTIHATFRFKPKPPTLFIITGGPDPEEP